MSPDFLLYSLAVGAVSQTVSTSVLFADFRSWIRLKSEFLGKLFTCPWCFSHWLALAAALDLGGPHFIARLFAIVMVANLVGYAWLFIYRKLATL
jgi:hypothetical protein